MSDRFCIIGESGSNSGYIQDVVRQTGLEPIIIAPDPREIAGVGKISPVAVLVERSVRNRSEVVDLLKVQETMVSVPLIACLEAPEQEIVRSAFQEGFDEFLVDDSRTQLALMCDLLQNRQIDNVVRPVVGTVLVADPDRMERLRLALPLKRSGFDIHFAADCEELERAIGTIAPRAVIANSLLPGGTVEEIFKSSAGQGKERRPWIFVSSGSSKPVFSSEINHLAPVEFVDSDSVVDSISFKINELLNPLPPGRRNSRRLLYGTPVQFECGAGSSPFFGYCYNINLGGLFIRTLTPLPMKTEIDVRFSPPFGRGQVAAKAQVTWRSTFAERNGNVSPPGIGVQFLEWDLADWAGFEAGYEALLSTNDGDQPVRFDARQATTNAPVLSHSAVTIQPAYA